MNTAIYLRRSTSIEGLEKIIDTIGQPLGSYFFAVDASEVGRLPFSELASISFYHIRNYHEGNVLFLNVEDFNMRARDTSAKKILVTTKEHLPLVEKDLLDESFVLLIKDKHNKIRKAKNAELQSIIRQ